MPDDAQPGQPNFEIADLFPANFDGKPPEYQRAWLRRQIPEVKQAIAKLEEELAQKLREEKQAHLARKIKREARRKQRATLFGWIRSLFSDPTGLAGMGDLAAELLEGSHGLLEIQIARAKDFQIEMEARLEALEHRTPSSLAQDPDEPRRKNKTRLQAERSRLKQEMKKDIAQAETPEEAQRLKHMYEDKLQRTEEELRKYL